MPESLVHRVRGEQIPAGKNHLRLLEVVVDEDQRPFWRARCLQSGNLLNVALDGFVKVPESISIRPTENHDDYVGERRRAQKRRRWIFLIGSLLLAAIAMHYQDTIMALLQKLQDIIRSGRVSI
ncbi:MAG: hypothetical protein L7V86_13040 [Verrucomicrobiales bacterium]|nr:hypothetical protein [Verrucomicrobiales bacterium]